MEGKKIQKRTHTLKVRVTEKKKKKKRKNQKSNKLILEMRKKEKAS
jgi:hypothetical protein